MLARWGQFAIHKSLGILCKLLEGVILGVRSGSGCQLLLIPQAAPFLGQEQTEALGIMKFYTIHPVLFLWDESKSKVQVAPSEVQGTAEQIAGVLTQVYVPLKSQLYLHFDDNTVNMYNK